MQTPLITLTAPALDGGIGRNLVNLAGSFSRSGYRVHVLVEKGGDPNLEDALQRDSIITLPTTHTVRGIPTLASYLFQHKPSAILTPVLRHTILALRARAAARTKTRICVNVHNTYSKLYSSLPKRKMALRTKRFASYYPRCDSIIAVSDGVADDFSALTGITRDGIEVIHNPIVNSALETASKERTDHPWFEPGQLPVILGVGRLVKAKNFPLLLAAFELIRTKIPCRCLIVGEGPLRSSLEAQAENSTFSEDIQFVGHKANPFPFMSKAAVFVLSSSWEGFGNVLVEAMATATPVVSTNCQSGPSEILEGGKYGKLVPMDDPDALAEAVLETVQRPPDSELTRSGAARYDVDLIAGSYLKAFGLDGTG